MSQPNPNPNPDRDAALSRARIALIVDNSGGGYQWASRNSLRSRTSTPDWRPMAEAIRTSEYSMDCEITGMWSNQIWDPPLRRGQRLMVRHDLDNPRDPYCCSLYRQDPAGDVWVGFLPAAGSRILARYLDDGHAVQAFVIEPGGDSAWSLEVVLTGGEPILAMLIGREIEDIVGLEDEVPLWRPPETAQQREARQERGWEEEVRRRCGRRAIDIFCATGIAQIPQYLGANKCWMKVNLEEVRAPSKPAFDQDLDDEIPF